MHLTATSSNPSRIVSAPANPLRPAASCIRTAVVHERHLGEVAVRGRAGRVQPIPGSVAFHGFCGAFCPRSSFDEVDHERICPIAITKALYVMTGSWAAGRQSCCSCVSRHAPRHAAQAQDVHAKNVLLKLMKVIQKWTLPSCRSYHPPNILGYQKWMAAKMPNIDPPNST